MDFKILSVLIVSLAVLAVFVFAQTPLTNPPPVIVNANSCSETDGGLNYFSQGTVTGSFWWLGANNTNVTYSGSLADTCISSTTLLEGVCGSSINSSLSNLAGALYVDCAAPNPAFGCVNGACVLLNTTGNSTGGGNGTNGTGNNSTNVTLPNLIIANITRLTYNATTTNGTNGTNGTTTYTVNVTAWVRNIGAGNAGPSVTTINYPALSPPISTATSAISAGQTRLVSVYYLNVAPGNYFGMAHADNTSVVAETNDFDNLMYSTIAVP